MSSVFLGAAVLLTLHHYAIHSELHGLQRFYQLKDFDNPRSHEFYINLCLVAYVFYSGY